MAGGKKNLERCALYLSSARWPWLEKEKPTASFLFFRAQAHNGLPSSYRKPVTLLRSGNRIPVLWILPYWAGAISQLAGSLFRSSLRSLPISLVACNGRGRAPKPGSFVFRISGTETAGLRAAGTKPARETPGYVRPVILEYIKLVDPFLSISDSRISILQSPSESG